MKIKTEQFLKLLPIMGFKKLNTSRCAWFHVDTSYIVVLDGELNERYQEVGTVVVTNGEVDVSDFIYDIYEAGGASARYSEMLANLGEPY